VSFWSNIRAIVIRDSPAHLVIGRLGASALALLSAPIVARAIGPDGRGETAAAIALFYIVPVVLALGVPLEVRRLAALSDGKPALRSARVLCLFGFALSLPGALALYFTLFSRFSSTAQLVASLGILLCPLTMSWMCDNSVLIAHCRYRAVFLVQIASPIVYVILVGGLWLTGRATTATVLISNISGTVVTFLLCLVLTRTSVRGSYQPYRKLSKAGIRYAGSSIAESASSRLDQVLVLPLIGSYQAGIYSVAATVASVPLALGHALGSSFFPAIARSQGDVKSGLQARAVRTGLALSVITVPPLCIIVAWGIPFVFGRDFSPAIPVAWASLIGSGAMLAAYVCSMALAADGRGIRMTVAQVLSLAAGIGLLYLLGPRFGAVGAAFASSISYMALLVMLILGLGVPKSRIIPRWVDFRSALKLLVRKL
jgi:O-antigen/teichoic acid export membrane protein